MRDTAQPHPQPRGHVLEVTKGDAQEQEIQQQACLVIGSTSPCPLNPEDTNTSDSESKRFDAALDMTEWEPQLTEVTLEKPRMIPSSVASFMEKALFSLVCQELKVYELVSSDEQKDVLFSFSTTGPIGAETTHPVFLASTGQSSACTEG